MVCLPSPHSTCTQQVSPAHCQHSAPDVHPQFPPPPPSIPLLIFFIRCKARTHAISYKKNVIRKFVSIGVMQRERE